MINIIMAEHMIIANSRGPLVDEFHSKQNKPVEQQANGSSSLLLSSWLSVWLAGDWTALIRVRLYNKNRLLLLGLLYNYTSDARK